MSREKIMQELAVNVFNAGRLQDMVLRACVEYFLGNGPPPHPEDLVRAQSLWKAIEAEIDKRASPAEAVEEVKW